MSTATVEVGVQYFVEGKQTDLICAGNTNVSLTFVITNTAKSGSPIEVSRVEINIPFAGDARALAADKAEINTAIGKMDPSLGKWKAMAYDQGFAFETEDGKPIQFTNEHSLQFTLTNVTVNKEVGIVQVKVSLNTKDGVVGNETATGETTISKMPYKFFLSDIDTYPINAEITEGGKVNLSWKGSDKANYVLYIGEDNYPVNAEVQNYQVSDKYLKYPGVNVTLQASVTALDNSTSTYQKHREIVVHAAPPEIIDFGGTIDTSGGKFELKLHWKTNASYCEINHNLQHIDANVKEYPITTKPLCSRYTLTAYNADSKSTSKTVELTTWRGRLPGVLVGSIPSSLCVTRDGNRLFAASKDGLVCVIDVDMAERIGDVIEVGSRSTDLSPLCMTPKGTYIFVGSIYEDRVIVIDVATLQKIGQPINTGNHPISLCMAPDGTRLYVANEGDSTVTVIDVATRKKIGDPIKVGKSPKQLCMTPDGTYLFVANYSDSTVTVIDVANLKTIDDPISVVKNPMQLCVTPDGTRLFVGGIHYVEGIYLSEVKNIT